jgi:hypothetical protein
MGANIVGVTIEANSAQVRAEFDKDTQAIAAMGRAIVVTNATAVKAFRETVAAQRELGSSVGASTAQMQRLDAVANSTEQRIVSASSRQAQAFERVGSGLGNVIRAGDAASGAINTAIMASADLAFAFGPQGAILSALALLTAGIAAHFERTRDELRHTREEFIRDLEASIQAGDPVSLAKKAAEAYIEALKTGEKRMKEAKERSFQTGGGFAAAKGGMFTPPSEKPLDYESPEERAQRKARADAATAVGQLHANDAQLKRLEDERKDLNSDIAKFELRLANLRAVGQEEERAAINKELNRLRGELIDKQELTRKAIEAHNRAVQAFREKYPRISTDAHERDAGSMISTEHRDRERGVKRESSDVRVGSASRRDAAERDAADKLMRIQADLEEARLRGLHREEDAELAKANFEYQIEQMALARLETSEETRGQLILATRRKYEQKVADIHNQFQSQVYQRQSETDRRMSDEGDAQWQRFSAAAARSIHQIVNTQESVVTAAKRAAVEPIIAWLEAKALEASVNTLWESLSGNFAAAARSAAVTAAALTAARTISGWVGGGGGHSAGASSAGAGGGAGVGLGAQGRGNQTMKVEVIVVQRSPDGRELSRIRQGIQRLDDRGVPIRVTALG